MNVLPSCVWTHDESRIFKKDDFQRKIFIVKKTRGWQTLNKLKTVCAVSTCAYVRVGKSRTGVGMKIHFLKIKSKYSKLVKQRKMRQTVFDVE